MAAQPSLGLFTDFYELTMAQAYWESGQTAPATFSLFFRALPPDRGYFVFAGLADVLGFLEDFRLEPGDIAYLRTFGRFTDEFLAYLAKLRFTGSVRAMPEGSIFFPNEAVLEVTAPIIEAQLVETYILNQVHLQTLQASKAARVYHAARGAQLVDFAARRCQGVDAANQFARLSYLVGFHATSNTLAGAVHDIPVFGTMAHSFITSFPAEIDAFCRYAESFPDSSSFLVDTYDTLEGVNNAVAVAQELKRHGHMLGAIRLDSGDLGDLAKKARALLDQAGLGDVRIFASGGLDEFAVEALLQAGAPIDGFGIGARVGVSADAPQADCAYKLVAYDGRPVLKLSPGKETLAGPTQVFRFRGADSTYQADVIAGADEEAPAEVEPLLRAFLRAGQRLEALPPLQELRRRFQAEFACLPEPHKALRAPKPYPVHISEALGQLQDRVAAETRQRELGSG
jgi:nicotinate phosphoribosyltransferase